MKNTLPPCPLVDPQSPNSQTEEAWIEGFEELLADLKFEEELPFKDPEEIWEEVCYILEEEELVLTDELRFSLRKLFDQVWPEYKD
jgi:hypothetical protein